MHAEPFVDGGPEYRMPNRYNDKQKEDSSKKKAEQPCCDCDCSPCVDQRGHCCACHLDWN